MCTVCIYKIIVQAASLVYYIYIYIYCCCGRRRTKPKVIGPNVNSLRIAKQQVFKVSCALFVIDVVNEG